MPRRSRGKNGSVNSAAARLGDDDADGVAAAGDEAPGGPVGDVARARRSAASTARRTSPLTRGEPLTTRETVARETPATLATCSRVAPPVRWSRPGRRHAVLHESALTLLRHTTRLVKRALSRFRRRDRIGAAADASRVAVSGSSRSGAGHADRARHAARAADCVERPRRYAKLRPCSGRPLWPDSPPRVRRVAELRRGAVGAAAADPRGRPDAHADRRDPPRPQPDRASAAPRATSPSRWRG